MLDIIFAEDISSFCSYLLTGFFFKNKKNINDNYIGRVDDVINPSGHRIGTAEIESALVLCREVSEAAVVGFPHELKGEGIGCFVILKYVVFLLCERWKERAIEPFSNLKYT